MTDQADEWISIEEAAALVKVAPRTVYRWADEGKIDQEKRRIQIPAPQTKQVRFVRRADVLRHAEVQESASET